MPIAQSLVLSGFLRDVKETYNSRHNMSRGIWCGTSREKISLYHLIWKSPCSDVFKSRILLKVIQFQKNVKVALFSSTSHNSAILSIHTPGVGHIVAQSGVGLFYVLEDPFLVQFSGVMIELIFA